MAAGLQTPYSKDITTVFRNGDSPKQIHRRAQVEAGVTDDADLHAPIAYGFQRRKRVRERLP